MNWTYTGVNDILADLTFSGGTLANNGAWTAKKSYYLDSYRYGSYSYPGYCYIGTYSSSGGCADSGSASTYGAYHRSYIYAYGPTHGTYPNKYRVYTNGAYFGPSAPVFTIVGFSANTVGTSFPGVTCNKVHIGPGPTLGYGTAADASGNLPNAYLTGASGISYNAAYAGIQVVFQSAWLDTQNGSMLISSANWSSMPAAPAWSSYLKVGLKCVVATTATATSGTRYTGSSYYIMMARYQN